jgi:hypothetical protein
MTKPILYVSSPVPSSPPNLSKELNLLYGALSSDNKRIFVKIYKTLWSAVCPLSRFIRFGGVLHSYWIVDLLRRKYKLDNTDLCMLSFIYHATDSGRKFINSKAIKQGIILPGTVDHTKQDRLVRLKKKGYLIRSVRDPDNWYEYRPGIRTKTYIKLSPSAISLIHSFEQDLHHYLMHTCLNDLRGVQIKKP